ncbi:50S ribosomal protein L25/general stress protein Ctc [Sphingomonas sp. So64.6b]|uniref:50S ribosomal protein L25/general stress protein Ctc n=1 Tax=Sphingomonas sp. So64.6b TaxID=2997354 RepID=UPI0016036B8F|nr:50S ribosomal protein L25/general stress protein Ctc [Sphingomonas sp. So64.6b]QNA84777.1 50S ribosomal protein L25/general stress protein Ctc [Sphingomonas sp. So64.6b]
MSEQLTLAAETREQVGKGASRSLRREGRVPAVIYGNKQEPLSIHVEEKALMRLLMTGHFMNSVVMVDAGGKTIRTLPKDVAFDAVSDRPVHVDFLRIGAHTTVHVNVPVVFTDEEDAPGIKKGNGVLNVVKHELELVCDAADIPDQITVSLAGKEIGDAIHISNIDLPKGVTSAITDRDFTIATIVPPTVPTVEDEEADAAVAEAQAAESAEAVEAEAEATEGGDDAAEGDKAE